MEQSIEQKEGQIKDLEEQNKSKETENDGLRGKNEKLDAGLKNKTTELHMKTDQYQKLESFNQ